MGGNDKIKCSCGSFVQTRNYKRHVNTKRHLEYVKLGIEWAPNTRTQDNIKYYASNKERLRLRRNRRYKKKNADTLNTQYQFIKTLFI